MSAYMSRLGFNDHASFFQSASVPEAAKSKAMGSRNPQNVKRSPAVTVVSTKALDVSPTDITPPASEEWTTKHADGSNVSSTSQGPSHWGDSMVLPMPELQGNLVGALDEVADRTEDGDLRSACRLMYELLLANTTVLDVDAMKLVPPPPTDSSGLGRVLAGGGKKLSQVGGASKLVDHDCLAILDINSETESYIFISH